MYFNIIYQKSYILIFIVHLKKLIHFFSRNIPELEVYFLRSPKNLEIILMIICHLASRNQWEHSNQLLIYAFYEYILTPKLLRD